MGVGNKLKELLKKRNMTVAELSRESKISAQTLYSIINRDSNISFENAILIAKILDIDYLELVDTENNTNNWRLKRERERDDIKRHGHVIEHTFEESVDYLFDSQTKLTSGILMMLVQSYKYTIEYKNGGFYLTNGNKDVIISRDDLEYVYKKAGEYVKNLLDSITNNELINKEE